MKYKNVKNKEVLIKFKETENAKELDELLYNFEKNINNINQEYFLKESENPFIYFLEFPKPEELIKKIGTNEKYSIIPVTCSYTNINHVTSTILRKIKNKVNIDDTFDLNCYLNTYCLSHSEQEIKQSLTENLKNIVKIKQTKNNPDWTFDIYIVGDITGINITRSTKNRNKYSHYMN